MMPSICKYPAACALGLLLALGAVPTARCNTGRPGTGEGALLDLLRERAVPFDRDAVSASALEATVAAVDPGGRLIAVGEAQPGGDGPSVAKAEKWAQGLCYLKLAGLHDDAEKTVDEALSTWVTNGLVGLVLDLRASGGNNLKAVDSIASRFVRGNSVLYALRDGGGKVVETRRAIDRGEPPDVVAPVMVLIDGGTGGASEALAAVLGGRRGVLLLGQQSSGDNGIREVIPFSASNSLYVATRWVTPLSGDAWQTNDYSMPDIVVAADDGARESSEPPRRTGLSRPLSDKARLDRELMGRVRDDPVLARATDILLGLHALGGKPSGAVGEPRERDRELESQNAGVDGSPADTSSNTATPEPCPQE